jgi:GT2 family glycosyltransferase
LKISIIIPSFQRELDLDNNIHFWQKELVNYNHHILVANASNYEVLKTKYSSNSRIIFLDVSEKFWWSESVNCALKKALDLESSHVLVTNDDMIYPSGLIDLFVNKSNDHEILTIPQLQNDRNIYYGSYIKGFFKDFIPNKNVLFDTAIIDLTNGSCLFIPIKIFDNIGLFNYLDLPHYFSDIEFILRARNNGYKLRLLNFKPIIQGPPTEFYKRFSYLNIFFHKGSPLNFRAVIFFGHNLYKNHFNLFFGMGMKYILTFFANILKFQFKKFKKSIIIRND